MEKTVFKRDFKSIWNDTVKFFMERDPRQVERGNANPKDKMALVFRWYLGLSSRWSVAGEKGREMDYQIWTGPSMGAFNNWVKATYLEAPQNRHVVDLAMHILRGCASPVPGPVVGDAGGRFPGSFAAIYPDAGTSNKKGECLISLPEICAESICRPCKDWSLCYNHFASFFIKEQYWFQIHLKHPSKRGK